MTTHRFLAAAFLVLAFSVIASGQDKPAGDLPGPKLDFPTLAKWQRSAPELLRDDGYTLTYRHLGERMLVSVYVYQHGRDKIPDDLKAEELTSEFGEARAALKKAQELGYYEKVEELEAGEGTLGDPKTGRKCLYARFNLTVDGRKSASELYLLPYKNYYLKLRITRAAEAGEETVKNLDALKSALAGMLGK